MLLSLYLAQEPLASWLMHLNDFSKCSFCSCLLCVIHLSAVQATHQLWKYLSWVPKSSLFSIESAEAISFCHAYIINNYVLCQNGVQLTVFQHEYNIFSMPKILNSMLRLSHNITKSTKIHQRNINQWSLHSDKSMKCFCKLWYLVWNMSMPKCIEFLPCDCWLDVCIRNRCA